MKRSLIAGCLLLSSGMAVPSIATAAEVIIPPQYNDMEGKRLSTIECAAVNLYHESRSESDISNVMVLSVMLNRVDDIRYPNSLCGVVFQNKQFSWTHDNKSDRIINNIQYKRLYKLAERVIMNKELIQGMSEGVTHYHTKAINPYWTKSRDMKYVTTLGDHVFYRWEKK